MKKSYILLVAVSGIFLLLGGCRNYEPVKPDSIGKINNLLIVVPNEDWKGPLGDTLRHIFARDVDVLPQREPLFDLYQTDPAYFNAKFDILRDILIIQRGKKNGLKFIHDKYAVPQLIVYLEGKSTGDLYKLLDKHSEQIIDSFKTMEKKVLLSRYSKKDWINTDSIRKSLHIDIKIPQGFKKIIAKDGFFWYREDLPDGSKNILLYSVPLTNLDSLAANIPKIRDSIGKKYIPGPLPNTWMVTEKGFSPVQHKVRFNGFTAVESRGLWEVENDFMGGPYLNYIIPLPKYHKAVIAEGFIYLPADNKRNMLLELEAILQTIKRAE